MDKDYRYASRQMGGDVWAMEYPADSFEDMLHLEKYVLDLGGEILSSTGEEIAFVIRQDSFWWWGKCTFGGGFYKYISIELWREMRLAVGQTLKVTPGMGDGEYLYFVTAHTEGKLQSMRVETFPECRQYLGAESARRIGDYSRVVTYGLYLDYNETPGGVYNLDDIPQESGDLLWAIKTGDIKEARSISLTLGDVMDIPAVKYGEKLGALLVKGAAWGSVRVQDFWGRRGRVTYDVGHPDLGWRYGGTTYNQTPEGDTLIWLPSGYWAISIMGYENGLVPVSSGELTVFTAPTNLQRHWFGMEDEAAEAAGDKAIEERGLSFLSEPKESGDTVKLDFLLFDSESKDPRPAKDDIRIICD